MSRWTLSPAFLVPVALLIALALMAPAARAAGFDLRWDACPGDGGVSNRNFACDTEAGMNTLVASFRLDQPINSVALIEGVLDLIVANGQPVPAWWDFISCRPGSLNADATIYATAAACADWSPGTGFAGVIGYDGSGSIAPGDQASHRRIKVACTHDVPQPNLAASQDYFLFNVQIDNFLTIDTGGGECAGCSLPACIVLNSLRFLNTSFQVTLLETPNSAGSNFATWQGGSGANCMSVPVKQATWGAIKSLYR